MPFEQHRQDGLIYLTSPLLRRNPGITHDFSTRVGGVSAAPMDTLNLDVGRGDAQTALEENYRRFCAALHTSPRRTVLSRQVHEDAVRLCTAADAGKGLFSQRDYRADALITNEPELPLVVISADCGLILLHDPVRRAVGAVHAGWRGCAAGIPQKAVEAMARAFGSRPGDIRAALGPCIGPCCFETDADVPQAMEAALGETARPFLVRRGAKWYVDLAGLNRAWLLRAGLAPEQVETAGMCTACHPELFWSHRKMGNARGAQAALIALTPEE